MSLWRHQCCAGAIADLKLHMIIDLVDSTEEPEIDLTKDDSEDDHACPRPAQQSARDRQPHATNNPAFTALSSEQLSGHRRLAGIQQQYDRDRQRRPTQAPSSVQHQRGALSFPQPLPHGQSSEKQQAASTPASFHTRAGVSCVM